MALQCAHVTVMKLWMHKPSQENVSHTNTQKRLTGKTHTQNPLLPSPWKISFYKIKPELETSSRGAYFVPENHHRENSSWVNILSTEQTNKPISYGGQTFTTQKCVFLTTDGSLAVNSDMQRRGIILITIYCPKTNQAPQQLTETSLHIQVQL